MNNMTISKRFSVLLLMLVTGVIGGLAQSLTISDFTIKAGETKDVAISLAPAAGQTIYGLQTDVTLSEGLTLNNAEEVGTALSLMWSSTNNRLVLLSIDGQHRTIEAGDIIMLNITAADGFSGGTVSLSNSRLTTSITGSETLVGKCVANVTLGSDVIINGNLEGEDVSCFFSKEAPYYNNSSAVIIDGVGVDGSRGIAVTSYSGASYDWDSQFWIRLPEVLPVGKRLTISFDYKASKDVSIDTQTQGEPGNYIYWDCIGSPDFTTEWQHYEKTVVVSADMDGFHSIAFNLAKNKEEDITFYFDNISIIVDETPTPEPVYINVMVNGKCAYNHCVVGEKDGLPFYSMTCRENKEEFEDLKAHIKAGVGVDGSRAAVVRTVKGLKTVDEETGMEVDANVWHAQFFVSVSHQFKTGEKYLFRMKYRADKEALITTEAHSIPTVYLSGGILGNLYATTEWQTIEFYGTITEGQNGMQTIAFDLYNLKDDNTYYFDDIEFYINQYDATEEDLAVAERVRLEGPDSEAIVDGERQKPQPQNIGFVTGQEFYLYNTDAMMFFTQGNNWMTQASLGSAPRKVKFNVANDGAYTLSCYCWREQTVDYSYMSEAWRDVFFDSETSMFVDRVNQANYYWEVEDNGNGTFRLLPSSQNPTIQKDYPNCYVGLDVTTDANNTALSPLLSTGNGHYIDWALVNIDEFELMNEKIAIYKKAQELKAMIEKIEAISGDASSAESVYQDETATLEELEEAVGLAKLLYIKVVIENASDKNNVDLSEMLQNPDFEESGIYEHNTVGWTTNSVEGGNVRTGGTDENKCFEAWNNANFDIYQEVTNMPVGTYEIEVQGFYRFDGGSSAYQAYVAQESQYVKKEGVPVYVYMNNNATPLVNVFAEPVPYGTLYKQVVSDGNVPNVSTDGQYWFPNDMENSAIAFAAGMYKQKAYGLVANDGETLRVGVKGASNQNNNSWAIWDNFKLTYRGFLPEVVQPVLETAMEDVQMYLGMLMGKTEYAALTTALADAATAIEKNDGEAMFNALNALYNAKDSARISKDVFLDADVASDTLRLAEAIRSTEGQKLAQSTLGRANNLLVGIIGNTIYENSQTDILKNDVSNMISSLNSSVSLYEQLNEAIGRLNNAIENMEQGDLSASLSEAADSISGQYEAGNITDVEGWSVCDMIDNLTSTANNHIFTSEWQMLKSYYEQADNGQDGWRVKWNFSDTSTQDVADVPGVTTQNGHITAIRLSYNNLSGNFPFALLNLPYLEDLNLYGNQLAGDIGQQMAAFAEENPTTAFALRKLVISYNQFSGNLGLFTSYLPELEYLEAQYNYLSEVIPVISEKVTTLNLTAQTIDQPVVLHGGKLTAKEKKALPSILFYDHDNQSYRNQISRLYLSDDNGWEMTTGYQDGSIYVYDSYSSYGNTYYGQSGDIVSATTSGANGCTFAVKLTFKQGDANFDGEMNVLDVQRDINYIFGWSAYSPFNFTAANLWEDEVINVQDVVKEVNLIMEQDIEDDGSSTMGVYTEIVVNSEDILARELQDSPFNAEEQAEATVYCQAGQLILDASKPVAAFDVIVSGASTMTMPKSLERMGFACVVKSYGEKMRIVGYSLSGAALPIGENVICSLSQGNATVSRALLSDKQAKGIATSLNMIPTDIAAPVDNDKAINNLKYRMTIGRNRAIVIDGNGHKTIEKK